MTCLTSYMYVLVKAWLQVGKAQGMAEMSIKHKVKLSAQELGHALTILKNLHVNA